MQGELLFKMLVIALLVNHKRTWDAYRKKFMLLHPGYNSLWRQTNPSKISKCDDRHRISRLKYASENSNVRQAAKAKRIANGGEAYLEKIRKTTRVRYGLRYRTDPMYRLTVNLRNSVSEHIRKHSNRSHTVDLLGCSAPSLMSHLESRFTVGMTWDNRGKFGWHVDHIRPISSFDLTNPKQVSECFHFSNLQPLWHKDNLRKGKKLEYIVKPDNHQPNTIPAP